MNTGLTGRILLIDRYGLYLGVREGRFQLREKNKVVADIPPAEVDSILLAVKGASISTAALVLAARHGIDVLVLDGWKPVSRLIPASYGTTLSTWMKQLKAHGDQRRRRDLAVAMVDGKIHNQRALLRIYQKNLQVRGGREALGLEKIIRMIDRAWSSLSDAETWRDALRVEAEAARYYWRGVKLILPQSIGFKKRLKRWDTTPSDPPDAFNKALNIGYGLLRSEAWKAVLLANLNPYIGYLHAYRSGRMSLVFDLMEEFRAPAVDRPLIKLARQKPGIIARLSSGNPELEKDSARQVVKTVKEALTGGKNPLRPQIMTQARRLAMALRSGGEYKPYKLVY